jgi:myo-inositol-1(or 4)-monophosphatase
MSSKSPEPQTLRALARDAALGAGRFLRQRLGNAGRIDRKSASIDLVTEADREAEAIIIDAIRASAPDHAILTEERGELGPRHAAVRWVVDPLDGTTNYARSFAMFAVSIGVELRGTVVAGVVHIPLLDELFIAERGAGAWLEHPAAGTRKPLHVSTTECLDDAFLATGFPYDIRTNPDNNLDHFGNFATRSLGIRRAGSAAIDLAYTAAGRFDGFWELRLKPWDWAAGILLIEEAGGRVTRIDGGTMTLDAPGVCASNGRIHDQMLAVLATSAHVRA